MAKAQLSAKDFVHLHNHTQYSLLDGLTKIPPLIEHIKKLGMESVAITDHGTLSGLVEFYKEAHEQNIKPIFGMEAYIAPRAMQDRDPIKDKNYFHIILLAMNQIGYQNLMQLSTLANLEGFYYKPRIDRQTLQKYNDGLIVLSGCIGGEVGDALRQGQYNQAKEIAKWYVDVFGDRYYLEVQDHGHPDHPKAWQEQISVTKQTFKLADELKIETVLTADAHYLLQSDQDAHEILLCVQTGSFLADSNRMSLKEFDLHVTDPSEIIKRWGSEHSDSIKNTKKIADRCEVKLELGNILLPKFPVPKGETEKSYLEKQVYAGLVVRYAGKSLVTALKLSRKEQKKILPSPVLKRAAFELKVIDDMNFNGYFLIIADFIGWGKDQGIVFGPGRGSAAGSIIAYSLKITELDPLKYDLLFERFLNPDRISMPDIDIDIQDSRRDEVIQYCIEKYGHERVANIVTFGRMAARNAVRDVARVLQMPYADADRLAKMIPQPIQGRHIPLQKSLKDQPELADEYKSNQQSKQVFDLAMQLEGTIRSHGVHAAGVVIAPDDIVGFVPLEKAQKGVIATQYSMGPIEDLGLLKMDFLGLSNLTIIKNTLRIVKKVFERSININEIPLNDKKTFELLQRGDTTGVFQFESSGMKRYLKELKPTVFDDIIAMGALYRPGPLTAGLTQKFINRKNGKEAISYDHENMKSALAPTYGVLVYQEQVMRIAQDLCGFSGGEADTLRKAIGKKKRDVMAKMKKKFVDGALKTSGVTEKFAEDFWKSLEGFADYAFNKSHSACYGMISYQTAFLKAHYPSAFMSALMTSDYDNTDRLAIEITECKHMGIEVLPPDINESFLEFAVVPKTNQIRFGLAAVKNVGTGVVEEILSAREGKPFESLEDFLSRVSQRAVNRKTLESLIKAGAFDRFEDRSVLLYNLDIICAFGSRLQKEKALGQTDLFSDVGGSEANRANLRLITDIQKIPVHEQLKWERELLGLYISQHPLSAYESYLAEYAVPLNAISNEHEDHNVTIGGSVSEFREITTKNGQKMAFAKIADFNNEIEIILFPKVYENSEGIWERDKVVLVNGKISSRERDGGNGSLKIMVSEAKSVSFEEAHNFTPTGMTIKPIKKSSNAGQKFFKKTSLNQSSVNKKLYLRLKNSDNQDVLLSLKAIIDQSPGTTDVVLVLGDGDKKQAIKLPMRIEFNDELVVSLENLIGSGNAKLN